jgi:predicted ATPase with chaperone activity
MQLSARAYHRVLTRACGIGAGKLSRTIADLAGAEAIQPAHSAESPRKGSPRRSTYGRPRRME